MPFSDYLGNPRIVTALRGMLATEQVPHAMLFSGLRGVGKFTLGRMFAQAANCERLRDDFCGQCATCLAIGRLSEPAALIEQGLAERGESADAATVERIPLLLEPHPDVCAIVPDPVRLRTPVARPVLRVGQLRAVQRAAYFKPVSRRRVFLVDGAETMRWDHANIFLKILEEPPESATLILMTPNPFLLLPTIRSRCLQFQFAPLEERLVEQILQERGQMSAADRKTAAQLADGSPGVALTLDLAQSSELRRAALRVLTSAVDPRSASDLFAQTTELAKNQKVPFETILELFYSLLTDVLELSAECTDPVPRNPIVRKELASLSRRVNPEWVARAVARLDELSGRLRRNINKQMGLDAMALSLAVNQKEK
jgi:DNA polymerase III subunit delta'